MKSQSSCSFRSHVTVLGWDSLLPVSPFTIYNSPFLFGVPNSLLAYELQGAEAPDLLWAGKGGSLRDGAEKISRKNFPLTIDRSKG
jgi:hypothetical protein